MIDYLLFNVSAVVFVVGWIIGVWAAETYCNWRDKRKNKTKHY